MKHTIRAAALLLCLCMLLAFCACNQDAPDDVPAGMMLASAAGADFRLYVPTSWNLNTAYGISGAYFNLSVQSTVSVVKYPISEAMEAELATAQAAVEAEKAGEARIDWFFTTQCKPTLEEQSLGGSFETVDEKAAALLDMSNAWRYHYKGIADGKTLHFVRVIAERDNAFYVFSFTVEESHYDVLLTNVETMLEKFVFAEPYEPDDYAKSINTEVEALEGMKIASGDDVAYRFFVPVDWVINREEEIFAAYVVSDRSSVSVVPYMPSVENMSVEQFFALCREQMELTAGADGFAELAEPTTLTLGGRQATVYTYRYRVGGRDFYYKQAVAAYKSMLYSVTYTAASPEAFDAHLSEVDAILSAFQFR